MYLFWGLLVVMTWGLNSPITKLGISDFPVFLFVALRFLGTGLLFFSFSKLQKKDLKDLFVISLIFNVGHIGLQYLSLHFLTASSSAAIQRIQVPLAVLFSVIFLKEKINLAQVLGMLISLVGVLIIYGIPDVNFAGFICIIMSAFFFAFTQILLKKTGEFHLPTFVAWTSLLSVPFLVLLSFLFDEKPDFSKIDNIGFSISMSFQIFVLGFSLALWQRLISVHGVTKLIPLSLLGIVFAIVGGAMILDEQPNVEIITGAFVIVFGVGMTTMLKSKESLLKNFLSKISKKQIMNIQE